MTAHSHRIDDLLQFALLLAGKEDDAFDRQLGPIHLIKYVYLADLAHARKLGGETYTGVSWQFYKFGPWSQAVNERIEPALTAIHADKQVFESEYEGREEWVRWSLRNEHALSALERSLPPVITMHLTRDVHKFGKNTADLLEHVYKTIPMLRAAPHELLSFDNLQSAKEQDNSEEQPLRYEQLSTKKKKKFAERMRQLRQSSVSTKPERALVDPIQKQRFDEVYGEGIAWLDSLGGEKPEAGEMTAEFSEDVWKSKARKGDEDDVSR